jgi:hypothetical protein
MKEEELQENIRQVSQIFLNLGAHSGQAEVMAQQLVRRARQKSEETGSSFVSELQALLETAVHGAQGSLKPADQGVYPPKNR